MNLPPSPRKATTVYQGCRARQRGMGGETVTGSDRVGYDQLVAGKGSLCRVDLQCGLPSAITCQSRLHSEGRGPGHFGSRGCMETGREEAGALRLSQRSWLRTACSILEPCHSRSPPQTCLGKGTAVSHPPRIQGCCLLRGSMGPWDCCQDYGSLPLSILPPSVLDILGWDAQWGRRRLPTAP